MTGPMPAEVIPRWVEFVAANPGRNVQPYEIWFDGWYAAIKAMAALAETEEAAQAVWACWMRCMLLQGRDVESSRLDWTTLGTLDQQLDQNIARSLGRRTAHRLLALPSSS